MVDRDGMERVVTELCPYRYMYMHKRKQERGECREKARKGIRKNRTKERDQST